MAQLIKIESVMGSVISALGLEKLTELPTQSMMEWMFRAMGLIGTSAANEDAEKQVYLENYKGQFPLDLSAPIRIKEGYTMHTIQGGFTTSVTDMNVTLVYQRIVTDERGFPMIPNDPSVHEALTWYVAKMLALRDELPNKKLSVQYCDSEWQWYCGQARGEGYAPTLDTWERMVNVSRRLIPDENAYANSFAELEYREPTHLDNLNSPRISENRL